VGSHAVHPQNIAVISVQEELRKELPFIFGANEAVRYNSHGYDSDPGSPRDSRVQLELPSRFESIIFILDLYKEHFKHRSEE
jgi:hypothetical protein